jgi:asparagine N-glycosylation enzyme membrane subunit Stt3
MGRLIFSLAVAVWLGTVVSFSYVFLPTILNVLEGHASNLLQRLFPRYYVLGTVCGLVALATVSLAPASPRLVAAERLRLAFPVVVSLLCTLAAQRFVLPRLAAARRSQQEAEYARLHRYSAMLNSTVLAMLVLAVAALATR